MVQHQTDITLTRVPGRHQVQQQQQQLLKQLQIQQHNQQQQQQHHPFFSIPSGQNQINTQRTFAKKFVLSFFVDIEKTIIYLNTE